MMRALVLGLVAVLAGCRTPPTAPQQPAPAQQGPDVGYPGTLVDTADMGAPFMARQRVTAIHGEERHSFEAVLQLHDGALTMVALTPFGTKAFVLEQRGRAVTFNKLVERELPFEPRYILLDIHRAMFMGLGAPTADEERSAERDGELLTEVVANGRISSRRFTRLDGRPAGDIVIVFPQGARPGEPPPQVDFDNGWFGYRLSIETLSWQPL